MGIIDRLLFKDIIKTLMVIVIVLLMILMSNIMVKLLRDVAGGSLSQDVVIGLIGFQLIKALGVLVPPAFFFSILWSLGRMYRDSEMTALSAAGVSIWRIYRSILIVALPLFIFSAVWGMQVIPWTKSNIESIKSNQEETAAIDNFGAGGFEELRDGNLIVYTESRSEENGHLQGMFIQNRQNGEIGVITADTAYQIIDDTTGDQYIVLADGQRYVGDPGSPEYSVSSFREYGVLLAKSEETVSPRASRGTIPSMELYGSSDILDQVEFQSRLAVPLAIFAFALVSVPLARSGPRQSIYGRLSLAILLYFVFMNLQRVAERWMERGDSPHWLGIWWVPLLFALFALVIIASDSYRLNAYKRRFRRKLS